MEHRTDWREDADAEVALGGGGRVLPLARGTKEPRLETDAVTRSVWGCMPRLKAPPATL